HTKWLDRSEVSRLLILKGFLPRSGTNRHSRRTLRNKRFSRASGTTADQRFVLLAAAPTRTQGYPRVLPRPGRLRSLALAGWVGWAVDGNWLSLRALSAADLINCTAPTCAGSSKGPSRRTCR